MVVCGPKVSTIGLVLSIWGIVQLALTGLLFHTRAVAFVEDLGFDSWKVYTDPNDLRTDLEVWINMINMINMHSVSISGQVRADRPQLLDRGVDVRGDAVR